ncbi:MAG: hypothetical protein ACKVZH_06435 [Blastocatellia bacterium]
MEEPIKSGALLISDGVTLPTSMRIETEPYAYGWRLVKNFNLKDFNQMINQAGWNFFYIAGAIETNAFGSDEKKTIRKAIKQVMAKLRSKNFNCLEITLVEAKRSFGMPYVSVSAHSRHIQKSIVLFDE